MPGRNYSPGAYSNGFGSQLKDDEIYGQNNAYSAEFWEYDPRLGRRWNVDPIIKEWECSYAAYSNNPIFLIDPDGLDTIPSGHVDMKTFNPESDVIQLKVIEILADDVNFEKRAGDIAWKNGRYNDWWEHRMNRFFGGQEAEKRFTDGAKPVAQFIANINPIVAGANAYKGFTSGTDLYGDHQSKGMATLNAAGAILPFMKFGSGIGASVNAGDEVFHVSSNADNLLRGIKPSLFRTWWQPTIANGNRFGSGFYVGLDATTALAEVGEGTMVKYTIGYSPKLMNLTSEGVSFLRYRPLSIGLGWIGKGLGYDGILFNSTKNVGGINMVLFNNFESILTNGLKIK